MYFTDAVKMLLRRWYVLLAGLLVMGGAAAGVVAYIPTNYEASANVLFLLPPDAAGEKPVNPYLNVPPGLAMTSSIVGGVLSTPEQQRDVFRAGFTSDYAVSQSPGTGIPLLIITAEDTDPRMAVATVKEVVRRITAELDRMQVEAGAPAGQRMVSKAFSVTEQAEVLRGSKVRALAVVGAVGMVLTTLIAFAVDRSKRRAAESRTAELEGDVAEPLASPAESAPRQNDPVMARPAAPAQDAETTGRQHDQKRRGQRSEPRHDDEESLASSGSGPSRP